MKAIIRSLLLTAILASTSANGYEQATHAQVTNAALGRSLLESTGSLSPLAVSLGLGMYGVLSPADSYYEFLDTLTGIAVYERRIQPYENRMVTTVAPGWTENPIQAWFMFGAIREDDNPGEDPPTPQDVATGLPRPLHHFFDPYNNTPLTSPPSGYGDAIRNVDWALGTADAFRSPNASASPRRNHFTVFDAREAMFRALTLKSQGVAGTWVDVAGGSSVDQERQRQLYWTTAMRALGDVLHLNQDMAQPQHTRDEMHSGIACPGPWFCPFGHSSIYEKYIRARTLGQPSFKALGPHYTPVAIQPTPLSLTTVYPIPRFSNFADYWSTSPGVTSLSGKGLADYSNRGFFTEQANLASTKYRSPSRNESDYIVREELPRQWDGAVAGDTTPVKVYYGQVTDTLDGQRTATAPLTTLSVWDEF
jgi:hypothetical protein